MTNNKITDLEKQLSMTRQKPRSLSVSIAYRLVEIGKRVLGKERLLRFCLNNARLFWRFAFEISDELYGAKFHNNAKALNEEILKKWIPEGGSVIDVGCSVGRWCYVSSKYAKTVVGIDYDEIFIAEARENSAAENIEFILGDVTKDLQGRKFDLALLTHVIEHIDDADKMLVELKNVADTLIVEVPDFEHDPLNWIRLEQNCPFFSDGDHVREYTRDILIKQLGQNGWEVLETHKHGGAVLAVAKQQPA